MDRIKGCAAAATGFCLFLALVLFIIAVDVRNMAGDRLLFSGEMLHYVPPHESGIPEEDYTELGWMTADYLTGKRDVFQFTYKDANGNVVECFHDYEAEHMADCRRLILLAADLRWILGGISLVLIIMCIALRKDREKIISGILAGFALTAAAYLAMLVWGLVDFDGLFTTFHRIAFTNDLWILNPGTDLLIRLMPTEFFVKLGIRLMLGIAAIALALFSVSKTIQMAIRKGRQEEEQLAAAAARNA